MTIDLPFVHAMKNEEVNLGVRSIVIGTTYGGPRHINHTRVPFGLVNRPGVPIERFRVQTLLSHI
eukprot:8241181-Pyramimonas_sp.AAC.1